MHKISSLVGHQPPKEREESAKGEHADAQLTAPSQAMQELKLIDFQALTDAYRTIQGYSLEKLKHLLNAHGLSSNGVVQNSDDPSQASGVKLDLNSLKNM